ncbi:MAG TPA: hypothetical protein VKB51_17090, partial [bacterium]|nr:hypothetical protein [bacterium]
HYSASGDSWGSVIPADTDDTLSMTEPSVAVDGSGKFVVAWRENATPGNVWVSSYEAGTGAWSSPLGLDTVDGAALTPTVLADDAGRITVVWRQEGDTAGVYDLWAVRYE